MENLAEILGVIIVLSPIVIFIFTMIMLKNRFRDQNVNLSHFLDETEVVAKQMEQSQPPANPDNENQTTPPMPAKRSASRLILFLSGITSLILAACITTYYFYMNIYCIECKETLDLSDFVNVLLALGIGVVPYAINQVKRIRL